MKLTDIGRPTKTFLPSIEITSIKTTIKRPAIIYETTMWATVHNAGHASNTCTNSCNESSGTSVCSAASY